jgi:hypothetical protein
MLKVKDIYLSGRSMKVNDDKRTHFCGDTWCGLIPFKNKFPDLFDICDNRDITVSVAADLGWQFTFRRQLTPDLQIQLVRLRILLDYAILSSGNDIPIWDWNKSGKFSVKSVYKDLSSYSIDKSFKHLWKAKISLKIKIWLWLIWHNAIATKDTMFARGWTGNVRCQFCDG